MADLNNTIVRGKLRVTEDINTNGNITGSSITGNGSGLTNLNASNISSGTLNVNRLADSGVTAGDYGDTNPQTPDYNATFKVPSISVNAKGIVTAIGEHTVTIPDNSSLVPYTGAANDVNLGNHSLLISDQTAASGPIIKVSGKSKTEDDTSITIKSTGIEFAGSTAIKALLVRGALNITDDTNTSIVNKTGFKAQFKEDPDGDGHFDTYYSTYGYDGINHNGKKLLLPEKEGTIALTNDLSTLLDKGTSSTNVNQVVYNPVEMKKALTVPSIQGTKYTDSSGSQQSLFELGGTTDTNSGSSSLTLYRNRAGNWDSATIAFTPADGLKINNYAVGVQDWANIPASYILTNGDGVTKDVNGCVKLKSNGGTSDDFVIDSYRNGKLHSKITSGSTGPVGGGWCIDGSKILTESSISTQQWKLTSTSGTVTTVNICTM